MSKNASGDARTEKQKARDKKNRGVRGHGAPTHGTTDPHRHYHRVLKTIRNYLAVNQNLRIANRKGAKKRAKNTVSKAAPLTPDRDARSRKEDLQGSHRKSG